MKPHRAKVQREPFRAFIGSIVSQEKLGRRFGRTASWVSKQGASVGGHVFSGGALFGEVWHRVGADGRDGYRRYV